MADLAPALRRAAAGAAIVAAAFIPKFEGTSHVAYRDAVGKPTICQGHTEGVKMGQTATDAVCHQYLTQDATKAAEAVLSRVKVALSKNELVAWTSFVFNAGEGTFAKSTALKLLNQGDHVAACNQLPRFIYAGKIVLRGLVTRRAAEQKLCLTPDAP